jgi:hypothetical protein
MLTHTKVQLNGTSNMARQSCSLDHASHAESDTQVEHKEISGATIRNYVNAIKIFCEMNEILVLWKKIKRDLSRSTLMIGHRQKNQTNNLLHGSVGIISNGET